MNSFEFKSAWQKSTIDSSEIDSVLSAKSIELWDSVPPPYNSSASVLQSYLTTYVNSGNFQSAREYLMKLRPFAFDRELWQQEYTDTGGTKCEDAGILIGSGDESLGQDLLQFFIRHLEEITSDPKSGLDGSGELMLCYLIDGSFDKCFHFDTSFGANGCL